jgi:hypothetical protein
MGPNWGLQPFPAHLMWMTAKFSCKISHRKDCSTKPVIYSNETLFTKLKKRNEPLIVLDAENLLLGYTSYEYGKFCPVFANSPTLLTSTLKMDVTCDSETSALQTFTQWKYPKAESTPEPLSKPKSPNVILIWRCLPYAGKNPYKEYKLRLNSLKNV